MLVLSGIRESSHRTRGVSFAVRPRGRATGGSGRTPCSPGVRISCRRSRKGSPVWTAGAPVTCGRLMTVRRLSKSWATPPASAMNSGAELLLELRLRCFGLFGGADVHGHAAIRHGTPVFIENDCRAASTYTWRPSAGTSETARRDPVEPWNKPAACRAAISLSSGRTMRSQKPGEDSHCSSS